MPLDDAILIGKIVKDYGSEMRLPEVHKVTYWLGWNEKDTASAIRIALGRGYVKLGPNLGLVAGMDLNDASVGSVGTGECADEAQAV